MKKKINPNRMELFRLRKRLTLARRGHKLLKDKLEGLVQELTERIPKYVVLRRRIDETFPQLLAHFTLATAVAPQGAVEEAVRQNASSADLRIAHRRFMGVAVPVFHAPPQPETYGYSLTQTPPELDAAFENLRQLPEMLFELAEAEKTLDLIVRELERTRRRTNALEHVLIPELQAQRKDIEQKIGEQERSNISRLMKVKDMLMEERHTPGS